MTVEAPAQVAAVPAGEVEVLVADDSPTNVFVLTAMLRALGFSTISAADGAEAVGLATERRPALVFMDVQMPGMDGIAAARLIRSAMPDRRVVIVAVTAHAEVRHLPDFKTAGFDDLLLKPVDLSVVRRAVEKWALEAAGEGRSDTARA
jgi:CheY-like chemotaxis protein